MPKSSDKRYAPNPGTPKGCKTKERHARTLTGKKYSFCGPGTCLTERIARGDKPINALDGCCYKHDLVYNKKDATRAQIQQSDKDLMTCAKGLKGKSLGEKAVTKIMDKVFVAKRALEDKKVISPEKMTSTKLYSKEQAKKEGYGSKKNVAKAVASLAGKAVKHVAKKGFVKGALGKMSALQGAVSEVRAERQVEKSMKRASKRAQIAAMKEVAAPVMGASRKAAEVLTRSGWDLTTKVTSAMRAQDIRHMLEPHLSREPDNLAWEGHQGGGISRK